MTSLIEMRDIVKVYPNGVVANEGVDFSVEKGEIHSLVGENGAGKTTLMKILYGLEQPTGGEISFKDQIFEVRLILVNSMKTGILSRSAKNEFHQI